MLQKPPSTSHTSFRVRGRFYGAVRARAGEAIRSPLDPGNRNRSIFSPDGSDFGILRPGEYEGNQECLRHPTEGRRFRNVSLIIPARLAGRLDAMGKQILFRSNRDSYRDLTQLHHFRR